MAIEHSAHVLRGTGNPWYGDKAAPDGLLLGCGGTVPPTLVKVNTATDEVEVEIHSSEDAVHEGVIAGPVESIQFALKESFRNQFNEEVISFYGKRAVAAYQQAGSQLS